MRGESVTTAALLEKATTAVRAGDFDDAHALYLGALAHVRDELPASSDYCPKLRERRTSIYLALGYNSLQRAVTLHFGDANSLYMQARRFAHFAQESIFGPRGASPLGEELETELAALRAKTDRHQMIKRQAAAPWRRVQHGPVPRQHLADYRTPSLSCME